MKRRLLIELFFTARAFAQERKVEKEERQVEFWMESPDGGSVEVSIGGQSTRTYAAFANGAIWVIQDKAGVNY